MQRTHQRIVIAATAVVAFALAAFLALPFGRATIIASDDCFGQKPTIWGTSGNDLIVGTQGPDVIKGLAGNDKVIGGGGNDYICGDEGDDILDGGFGDDLINGGSGNDLIAGGGGSDACVIDPGDVVPPDCKIMKPTKPSPTPTPTRKASPTRKATPVATPGDNDWMQVDANCENPFATPESIEAKWYVSVGATFRVCIMGGFPSDSASGYQVRVHWSEDVLDLNPRTAGENDQWRLVSPPKGGPPNGCHPHQDSGPTDDGSGSDAYIQLSCIDFKQQVANIRYQGPLAQFEFTCQAHGAANIELRDPGVNTYFVQPGGPVKPTLADAVVIGVTPSIDSDLDGCRNDVELGPYPAAGGRRDPLNFWDFFDTPVPNSKWPRDHVIDLNDVLRVAARFATTGDPTGEPLLPPPKTGYHTAYDRTSIGPEPWDLGPPNGAIGLTDINLVIAQFAHKCT